MPGGRTRTRFTVAIDPGLAKALDARVRGKGTTRSAAVEEALSWWLRMLAEQEAEELEQLSNLGNGRRAKRSEATEARIAAEMVLEALRYQFPAMQDVSDYELRRRALSKLNGGRGGT